MTTVTPDVDTTVLEDLEFSVPCHIAIYPFIDLGFTQIVLKTPKRCTEPAAYSAICTHCFHLGLVCEKHRAKVLAEAEITCGYCEAVGTPDEVLHFTPLVAS